MPRNLASTLSVGVAEAPSHQSTRSSHGGTHSLSWQLVHTPLSVASAPSCSSTHPLSWQYVPCPLSQQQALPAHSSTHSLPGQHMLPLQQSNTQCQVPGIHPRSSGLQRAQALVLLWLCHPRHIQIVSWVQTPSGISRLLRPSVYLGCTFRNSLPWALFRGSDLSHGAQHLSMTPLIFVLPVQLRLNCLQWPFVVWYQASGSLHDPFKPCSSQAAKTTTNQMRGSYIFPSWANQLKMQALPSPPPFWTTAVC